MIVEPVVSVILHCSRCNTPYLDCEYETPEYWDGLTRIAEVFHTARRRAGDDVNGWRCTSDERYLCEGCHVVEAGEVVEKPSLPAIDEARVLRAQSDYAQQVAQVVAYMLAPPALLDPKVIRP